MWHNNLRNVEKYQMKIKELKEFLGNKDKEFSNEAVQPDLVQYETTLVKSEDLINQEMAQKEVDLLTEVMTTGQTEENHKVELNWAELVKADVFGQKKTQNQSAEVDLIKAYEEFAKKQSVQIDLPVLNIEEPVQNQTVEVNVLKSVEEFVTNQSIKIYVPAEIKGLSNSQSAVTVIPAKIEELVTNQSVNSQPAIMNISAKIEDPVTNQSFRLETAKISLEHPKDEKERMWFFINGTLFPKPSISKKREAKLFPEEKVGEDRIGKK